MSDEFNFDLVMPFLPVQSNGGPHDDDAFVAGFEMGRLDGLLQAAEGVGELLADWPPESIHRENREQADLIAMRYGFIATFEDYDEGEVGIETAGAYVQMTITQASMTP